MSLRNNIVTAEDIKSFGARKRDEFAAMESYRDLGMFTLALILAVFFLFPFYWLLKVSIAFPPTSLYGRVPSLLLENPSINNFVRVWHAIPFARYLMNSIFISVVAVTGQLIFCSMAAYALTKQFFGKRFIVIAMIFALMVPFQTIFLPDYLVVQRLGFVNTYIGLIMIWTVSLINTMVIRNSFEAIPQAMEDAARLDGASELYILFGVYWPLSKPALATTVIIGFIFSWNSYLWPLLVVTEMDYAPLPLGLVRFAGNLTGNFALQYAFALMVLIPMLIVFLLLQKQFIKSAVLGSIKT